MHLAQFLMSYFKIRTAMVNMSATFEHAWWRRILSVSYMGFLPCFWGGRAIHYVNAMKECLVYLQTAAAGNLSSW